MTLPLPKAPPRIVPPSARRIMRKHGLPEPTARLIASLAYGGPHHG